jgi:RNA polymerase sigma-70 factor (ECF subfamily)
VDTRIQTTTAGARALSDDALVARCAVGENAALAELFKRHGEHVCRLVSRMPGVHRRDRDDLVQATFIDVYRGAATFGGRSAVGTWILGIAANVVRHHVRKEVRRRALASAAASEGETVAPRRPDDAAVGRELMALLERALASLPQDVRLVFTLCELEDVKGAEVARILGMPEGTVWRKLHEARTSLREAVPQ